MARVTRKSISHALTAVDLAVSSPAIEAAAVSQTIPYENLPELIRLQINACVKFGINATTDTYPLHDTLVEHFVQQRLSNWRRIKPNLAKKMATCCRPVDAMEGGPRKR
jgi:hypothetical protein